MVVDLGWMRRDRGYFQVSYNDLNVAPPSAPDSARFERLAIKTYPSHIRNDYHTLVIGQIPGDAQHDLAHEQDVLEWGRGVALKLKELNPRRKVYWRPHPGFIATLGPPSIMASPGRHIREFMDQENVNSAVVYNSTVGLELLRLGARVVAQGPRTVYTELTSPDIEDLETSHPGPDAVRALMERLSYGQYQLNELSRWEMLEQVLDLHGITGDWK